MHNWIVKGRRKGASSWSGLTTANHLKWIMRMYTLRSVKETRKQIKYVYDTPYNWNHSLYLVKQKFTKEELSFVNELFHALDQGNLALIKGIIHSKNKKNGSSII